MAAVGLLYVGAVLFVNGLALMGLVKGTSMIPMNLFVGLLQVITPLYLIFTARGDQAVIIGASGLFLFGFTYLYVAMNNAFDYDGTGLGFFSLFVAITAVVYSYWNFSGYAFLKVGDNNVGDLLGVLWATWAVLWFFFFLVLGLGKTGLTVFTGAWYRLPRDLHRARSSAHPAQLPQGHHFDAAGHHRDHLGGHVRRLRRSGQAEVGRRGTDSGPAAPPPTAYSGA